MAKRQLTSVVSNALLIFAEKVTGNVKHCTNPKGFPKGDRDPTLAAVGEGSQGEGEIGTPSPCARLW